MRGSGPGHRSDAGEEKDAARCAAHPDFHFRRVWGGLVVPEDNLDYPRRIIPEFALCLANLFEVEVESRASVARRVLVLFATFVS